jgi:hypothetical protein
MLFLLFFGIALGRIHDLKLEKEERIIIDLSSFAYNKQGVLNVTFNRLQFNKGDIDRAKKDGDGKKMLEGKAQLGFILEKLNSRGAVKYTKDKNNLIGGDRCEVSERNKEENIQIIQLSFYNSNNITNTNLQIKYNDLLQKHNIKMEITDLRSTTKGCLAVDSDEEISRKKREIPTEEIKNSEEKNFEIQDCKPNEYIYQFQITWKFGEQAEGLYELTFHNCFNLKESSTIKVENMEMHLTEKNFLCNSLHPISSQFQNGTCVEAHYLSSGDMPLPMVYGFCSFLFFLAFLVWLAVLRQKNQEVYRIHYLMLVLVFFKALSVMFHALDYRFLDIEGKTDAWTIIFYVVHLLKGGILIVTLTLIGSGWAFIKYVLADREKKIFLIVVPLQVFVNISYIILSETEEGEQNYTNWSHIMILLDLLCYAIILWPVYWSIKHLEQSSQTDGKAARNLEKLDLFRNFYILFVLYIYFTRIVVYILRITLPPHLTWVDELSEEIATLVFFILTGYKFRPGCNNPYFKLENSDHAEVLTKTGLTEKVQKRKNQEKNGEKQALLNDSEDEEDTILDTANIATQPV